MRLKGYIAISITIIMFAFIIMFGIFNLFGTKDGQTEMYSNLKEQNISKNIYGFTVQDIDNQPVSLSEYKGKVILIVNVASKCGYTPQYAELQSFYEKYKDQGVEILGFPANNFLRQEPGDNATIKEFCKKNYGVTFPMFSKISVKGKDMAPLYKFLTSKEENGVMDTSVKWNFQKYLIDREGRLVTFFDPKTHVDDDLVTAALQKIL